MIRKKTPKDYQIIDLTGPEGNAWVLMGYARNYAKQLGLNGDTITEEMMAGDYEDLLEVFDAYFGAFVILER
jgi:hypothetical protein